MARNRKTNRNGTNRPTEIKSDSLPRSLRKNNAKPTSTTSKQPHNIERIKKMKTKTLPECWQKLDDSLNNGIDRVLLYGAPGTGKTFAGLTMKPTDQNAYRLICTDEMTTATIEGAYLPDQNGFAYREGVAVKAWREGARLVIDEINRANSDVMSLLLAFTDTVASSSWQNPQTLQIVRPMPEFSVIMTMNGEPDDLEPALLDRFTVHIEITEPHPQALEQLPEYLRNPAKVFATLRDNERASLRAFMTVAQLEPKLGLARALEIALPKQKHEIEIAIKVAQQAKEAGKK